MRRLLSTIALFTLTTSGMLAQDPVKVAPKSFKIEIENDQVRVLRTKRTPHQKVPIHEHPDYEVVFLTDAHQKATSADGKVTETPRKAGDVIFSPAIKHAEENLSDEGLEAIVVE